jgi:hypothetical protein
VWGWGRRGSEETSMRYAHCQKIGIPNKIFGSKLTKGRKQGSQNLLIGG